MKRVIIAAAISIMSSYATAREVVIFKSEVESAEMIDALMAKKYSYKKINDRNYYFGNGKVVLLRHVPDSIDGKVAPKGFMVVETQAEYDARNAAQAAARQSAYEESIRSSVKKAEKFGI